MLFCYYGFSLLTVIHSTHHNLGQQIAHGNLSNFLTLKH